jgi:hypothetical protein
VLSSDLVLVRTFLNDAEAELALSALEAAGIHAILRRDDCGGMRPSLWLSGIKLQVRPDDEAAARELLDTPAIYQEEQDE